MNRIFKFLRKAIKIVSIAGLSLQIFLAFMMILIDLPAGFMLAIIFVVFDLLLWFNFGKPTIYKNIIIGSSLMIVFLTGCIYAILFRIVNFIEIPKQYYIGSASDWISYSGSIIGGSMTMFALLFTINNEKTIREKEKSERANLDRIDMGMKLMPLVKIVPSFSDKYECKTKCSYDGNIIHANFKLKNTSTNHARDISISIIDYLIDVPHGKKEKIDITNKEIFKDSHINILASGDETVFTVAMASENLEGELVPGINSEGKIFFSLILNISLFDIHNIYRHSFSTNISGFLEIECERPGNDCMDKYYIDTSSEYAKFGVNITECNTDLI